MIIAAIIASVALLAFIIVAGLYLKRTTTYKAIISGDGAGKRRKSAFSTNRAFKVIFYFLCLEIREGNSSYDSRKIMLTKENNVPRRVVFLFENGVFDLSWNKLTKIKTKTVTLLIFPENIISDFFSAGNCFTNNKLFSYFCLGLYNFHSNEPVQNKWSGRLEWQRAQSKQRRLYNKELTNAYS